MITEKQLKDRVTPDIIKKMVELAEGFEWDIDYPYPSFLYKSTHYITDESNDKLFPLLIHRAVEGFNHQDNMSVIIIFDNRVLSGCLDLDEYDERVSPEREYYLENYQPENLTACELAMLDCLIEIFK